MLHIAAVCSNYRGGVMTSKARITINITDAEYAALSDMKEQCQVSIAWLGRRAITELLEKYRKNPKQMVLPLLHGKDSGVRHD